MPDPRIRPEDRYLLTLTGGGDTILALVDLELWTWVQRRDTPGRTARASGWYDTEVPRRVVEAMAATGDRVHLTIGSFQNDRALYASREDVDGVVQFDSVRDLTLYLRAHPEIALAGEFDGCIY